MTKLARMSWGPTSINVDKTMSVRGAPWPDSIRRFVAGVQGVLYHYAKAEIWFSCVAYDEARQEGSFRAQGKCCEYWSIDCTVAVDVMRAGVNAWSWMARSIIRNFEALRQANAERVLTS